MKFGITINIGNYNSMRCESSEHKTLLDCYEEILHIISDWSEDFDSINWWINKLRKKEDNNNELQLH